MLNKKDLKIFKKYHEFSKEEVLESFEYFITHHDIENAEGYSKEGRIKLKELCEKFKIALQDSNLPTLTDDWWFYDFRFLHDGIILEMLRSEEFQVNKNGGTESTDVAEYTMLSVKCDYISVEQFADYYGVKPITVHQWIRRGKLRSAKKFGRDWRIPSIAGKPERGFEDVTYSWRKLPDKLKKEFPFLKGNNVYIYQDEVDKTKFHCINGNYSDNDRTRITIDNKKRERLELALISEPDIDVEEMSGNIKFTPIGEED